MTENKTFQVEITVGQRKRSTWDGKAQILPRETPAEGTVQWALPGPFKKKLGWCPVLSWVVCNYDVTAQSSCITKTFLSAQLCINCPLRERRKNTQRQNGRCYRKEMHRRGNTEAIEFGAAKNHKPFRLLTYHHLFPPSVSLEFMSILNKS